MSKYENIGIKIILFSFLEMKTQEKIPFFECSFIYSQIASFQIKTTYSKTISFSPCISIRRYSDGYLVQNILTLLGTGQQPWNFIFPQLFSQNFSFGGYTQLISEVILHNSHSFLLRENHTFDSGFTPNITSLKTYPTFLPIFISKGFCAPFCPAGLPPRQNQLRKLLSKQVSLSTNSCRRPPNPVLPILESG